jgi:hypothetical protein
MLIAIDFRYVLRHCLNAPGGFVAVAQTPAAVCAGTTP